MQAKKQSTLKEKKIDACWLKYGLIQDLERRMQYIKWGTNIAMVEAAPVVSTACTELTRGIKGLLGINPAVHLTLGPIEELPCVILGILGKSEKFDALLKQSDRDQIQKEGFRIKSIEARKENCIVIAGKDGKGVLYGVFSLLRFMQMQADIRQLDVLENPKNPLRIINHWDNLDGSVERGYAGRSIFFKNNKVTRSLGRIKEYARLLASVGINGVVINNVNVHQYETRLKTKEYLSSVAKLADIFGKYGIRLFLSINFASPIELGNMETADPLEPSVLEWWKNKTEEIYSYIPDFGGYMVKADSEFRPGPFTYGRTHADGANMLAEALRPFGGIVIWRCFVYNCLQDWRDYSTDRAKAAYDHFKPLDGSFHENVVLQIKNGPMDFQVREPVSPLFGGLEKTNHTLELQITQEYTGQQKHLCYLIPMWKEILDFDTYARGKGSTVKRIVSGSLFKNKYSGISGISNIGDDANWTGFQLAQSNLYGFGRLAWDPDLSSQAITEEWVRMTYSNDRLVVDIISKMLLDSWRIYENYTSPLGIGWMVNPNHHFGPSVDGYEYQKWGTYHRADFAAIGVDRTVKSGTGYTGQYHNEVAELYENPDTCPEELLLFFHRIPYQYKLKSGETLIQHIYNTHFEGVEQAIELKTQWLLLKDKLQSEVFEHVLERLEGQIEHAKEWRDVINTYFYRKTGIADEKGRSIY
ncbi:MAG: alpha-glucuronidase [Clostridia bacterium]|nr:alpha-glucuronidase [Clostridia bacterium]